ncbi:MAG: hypothetical protein HYV60_10580 [Planctomycetia bacterium]|nr:hypothetical protein [Planctomycetia bacterium]
MATVTSSHSHTLESISSDAASDEAASVEERAGFGTLMFIIFGILGSALAAAVLTNALVAWSL